MTNYELAVALARLGARTAMGARHRPVGRDGVRRHAAHAPDRPTPSSRSPTRSSSPTTASMRRRRRSTTLSPNGDGVDDAQTFTYKLVRASQVTATVVGPDRRDASRSRRTRSSRACTPSQWDGAGAVEGRLALRRHRARRHGAHDDCRAHVRAQPDARCCDSRSRAAAPGVTRELRRSRIRRP